MPVDFPPYRPPAWARTGHTATVLPTLFRRVEGVEYRRERLELADGDFLDLDWVGEPSGRPVAVVAHGLEGSSRRPYVLGLAKELARRGWTVCAWNLRGCSGEPNRLRRAYHSGATEDLDAVVQRVLTAGPEAVAVAGFSLGGNLTLKWLGDLGPDVDPRVVAAAGVSVPVDLASSARTMEAWDRQVYMRYFLRKLVPKLHEKAARFPDAPDPTRRLRTFRHIDDHVTAPLHGFDGADDYWARASALPVLRRIAVPTLLVNARDDPFLGPACYPEPDALGPNVRLLAPRHGGHVGFATRTGPYWSETVVGHHLDRCLEARSARENRE